MLEGGYTAVCEFHYLHHDPDGSPYANPAEMSQRLIAAARDTGIRMTLLPVLYMTAASAAVPPRARAAALRHDVDGYLRLSEALRGASSGDGNVRVGIALHRLRAVPPAALAEALRSLARDRPRGTDPHPHRRADEAKSTTASRGAASGRSNGCSRTSGVDRAGASSTRRI